MSTNVVLIWQGFSVKIDWVALVLVILAGIGLLIYLARKRKPN